MSSLSFVPAVGSTDLYSVEEIALAAGVSPSEVREVVLAGRVIAFRGFVAAGDAVALVRELARGTRPESLERAPITLVAGTRRSKTASLLVSGTLHGVLLFALIVATTLGLFAPADASFVSPPSAPARLVYLVQPGPGGGGGGGGFKMQLPPPIARAKAPAKPTRKISSPVVRVKAPPPPPRPKPVRAVTPPPVMTPVPRPIDLPKSAPPQAAQAPIVTAPADPIDQPGLLSSVTSTPSSGSGALGGVGSGAGSGMGEGDGGGIGAGSGGGAGGGPFRAGSGIEPPAILREVRPTYTEDARRRAIEGEVDLEIVVLADGRVGNVRVLRGLGAGLNERAVAAVRQWRFSPARRRGLAVDVVVNVSVGFHLR